MRRSVASSRRSNWSSAARTIFRRSRQSSQDDEDGAQTAPRHAGSATFNLWGAGKLRRWARDFAVGDVREDTVIALRWLLPYVRDDPAAA